MFCTRTPPAARRETPFGEHGGAGSRTPASASYEEHYFDNSGMPDRYVRHDHNNAGKLEPGGNKGSGQRRYTRAEHFRTRIAIEGAAVEHAKTQATPRNIPPGAKRGRFPAQRSSKTEIIEDKDHRGQRSLKTKIIEDKDHRRQRSPWTKPFEDRGDRWGARQSQGDPLPRLSNTRPAAY